MSARRLEFDAFGKGSKRGFVVIIILLVTSTIAAAQGTGTIRIVSNQVLVPVDVVNADRYDELRFAPEKTLAQDITSGNMKPFEDSVIGGLEIKDFELLEDGHKQTIQSLSCQLPLLSEATDNRGRHYEYIGPGGGRWAFPDLPTDGRFHAVIGFPYYVLAYTPPSAREGSCHQIEVKVRHHNEARIYTLDKYCRTPFVESDPLRGTKFGQRMLTELESQKEPKIRLLSSSAVLFSADRSPRLNIAMEVPLKSLRYDWSPGWLTATIGMSGSVHSKEGAEKNGELAAQFGDLAVPGTSFLGVNVPLVNVNDDLLLGCVVDSIGYQRQTYLPPGQYDLRVVFAVGEKRFGRAEMQVTVEAQDDQRLALSGIVIARRYAEAPNSPGDALAGTYVPLVSHGVEYLPAANLNFKKTDPYFFYLEVRGPLSSGTSNAAIQVRLRIVDVKSGAVIRNLAPINAADFAIPGNPIVPIGSGIHIDDLPPGQYRLEAQATTLPAAHGSVSPSSPPPPPQTTAWRSVSFTIQ